VQLGRAAACALDSTEHAGPRGAGVKPDVHRVGALAPLAGFSGIGLRQQPCLVAFPPDIGAVLGNQALDMAEGGFIEQHLTRFAVIEDRDRHPPGALAADAPVPPLADHRLDAVAAAGG